jgi:hypothetical protein
VVQGVVVVPRGLRESGRGVEAEGDDDLEVGEDGAAGFADDRAGGVEADLGVAVESLGRPSPAPTVRDLQE